MWVLFTLPKEKNMAFLIPVYQQAHAEHKIWQQSETSTISPSKQESSGPTQWPDKRNSCMRNLEIFQRWTAVSNTESVTLQLWATHAVCKYGEYQTVLPSWTLGRLDWSTSSSAIISAHAIRIWQQHLFCFIKDRNVQSSLIYFQCKSLKRKTLNIKQYKKRLCRSIFVTLCEAWSMLHYLIISIFYT